MISRLTLLGHALVAFLLTGDGTSWGQVPADFTPLVYEAEDYTTPKDAWQVNKPSKTHWSAVMDDNGNGLWTTGFGHPDFCFVGDIDPAHPGLEIFYGIEPPRKDNGLCLVGAKTGTLLWGLQKATNHVGTDGMCADVDERHAGSECHAADLDRNRRFAQSWLFSAQGELLSDRRQGTMSQPVYWDADPQRELLRGSAIHDFNGAKHAPKIVGRLVAIADLLGDWREEVLTSAPGELRIYTTTILAKDRRPCLMQDPIYRIDVAVAGMGYYATPMLSYDMASQSP